jgi:hypothetical protein
MCDSATFDHAQSHSSHVCATADLVLLEWIGETEEVV